MKELEQGLNEVIETSSSSEADFLELSKRWATHSLATYKDGLLTKALQISKALAEFDCELKTPGQWG